MSALKLWRINEYKYPMHLFIFKMEISAISEAAAGAVEIFVGGSSFCVEIVCGAAGI